MGKRVFEVAKELGVDHRELLRRCDQFRIDVKNYMSVLKADDEARLREAFEAERKPRAVDERIQAPGVVRRRRRSVDDKPSKPPVLKPTGGNRPMARSGRPAEPPGARTRRPVLRPGGASTSAPASSSPAAPAAEREVESRATASAAPPSTVDAASAAPPREARSIEVPAETAREPSVETPKITALPAGADATGSAKSASTPVESAHLPGPEAGPSEPGSTESVEHDAAASDVRTVVNGRDGPREVEVQRTPSAPAAPRTGAAPDRRTTGAGQQRATGSAQILGRIPIEQLRSRTQRPPARRGPGGDRRVGGGAPGGPAGRTGPGGPPGAPPGPRRFGPRVGVAGGPPPPLPDARAGDRRRRGPAEREADRGRDAGRAQKQKRRVYSREDLYANTRGTRGRKRKVASRKGGAKTILTTPAAHKRVVRIDETISVGELGKELGVKASEIIGKLMQMGVMATINQQVDTDTALLIATEYDYEVKDVSFDEDAVLTTEAVDSKVEVDPDAILRAPVVTIMGHVDHGKTTLLDRIRRTNVASGEAGGITQHIGAYKVAVGAHHVVFLDTPGHAAFTAMRARGAQLTDVVVLVVAADDGVMPQTAEAVEHAKAAGVPILVAITKIDKPSVDPERIKQELTKFELVPEEWGGETMYAPVSGVTGQGVDELLEALALQAEVLELRANPTKSAYGRVVEARLDKGRGPVATVLVQEGTLKQGDYIVSGPNFGRVRAMTDEHGKRVKEAGPSTPVEILGLGGVPGAGDAFQVATSEKEAKKVVSSRLDKEREAKAVSAPSVQDLFAMMGKPEKEELPIIIKTDVQGSLEAIRPALDTLATDEVGVKLILGGVGGITESDVNLAHASEALVIGFGVDSDGKARRLAEQHGVDIRTYQVIYELIDAVKDRMSGLLAPELVEKQVGRAEVKAVFHIPRMGPIAGCLVQDGKVVRNSRARVTRAGRVIHAGKISGLKRFKDDVREVSSGYECGIAVDGFSEIEAGDVIDVFEMTEVRRQLS